MFSGQFREAKDLAKSQKTGKAACVRLPDDDAEKMLLVCELLHNRDHNIDLSTVTLRHIQEASIISDKYGCGEALRPMIPSLIKPLLEKDCLPELMVASYRFGCAASLAEVTKKLIYGDSVLFHAIKIDYQPGFRRYLYSKSSFQMGRAQPKHWTNWI